MKSLKDKKEMKKLFLKLYKKYIGKDNIENTLDLEKDVKKAILDVYKYDEYNQELLLNGVTKKSKDIRIYFFIKYNILLFEHNDIEVFKAIFGNWRK